MAKTALFNTCQTCAGTFSPKRNVSARYCSAKCRAVAAKEKLEDYVCQNQKCLKTYRPQERLQRFCSKSCSAIHNNPRVKSKPREHVECRFCGTPLTKSQSQFCSHMCRVNLQCYEKRDDWVLGLVDASYTDGQLMPWARQLLVEMCGSCCSRCGWGEVNPSTGKAILSVDHVDGNWNNNYCWNLVVLCYNCHTLTPTFGSLNKGSRAGTRPKTKARDIRNINPPA